MTVVPAFRRRLPPAIKASSPDRRGSRHERGYDADWTRLSAAFRRKNPLCRFCDQEGRTRLCDVVDHVLPVRDFPERRLDRTNLQGLCTDHHGLKGRMEDHARQRGRLADLARWSAEPESRPARFRRV